MNNEPYRRPDLIELDPDKREWMYDGAGNKVYKNNYTNAWHTPNWFKKDPPPNRNMSDIWRKIL